MASCISNVQIRREFVQILAHLDTKPNSKHLINSLWNTSYIFVNFKTLYIPNWDKLLQYLYLIPNMLKPWHKQISNKQQIFVKRLSPPHSPTYENRFDLRPWPNLNINRDHLLIKDELTKYEATGAKMSELSIAQGMGKRWPINIIHLPTCAKQYAVLRKGRGIKMFNVLTLVTFIEEY